MEPESSVPSSHSYCEPDESAPCLGILFLHDPVNIIPPTLRSTRPFLSFEYSSQTSVRMSRLMPATCPAHLVLGYTIVSVIFGYENKL
jgi:hypothetical protein